MLRRAGRQVLARILFPSPRVTRLGISPLDAASGIRHGDGLSRSTPTPVIPARNDGQIRREISPKGTETAAPWSFGHANGVLGNGSGSPIKATSEGGDYPLVETVRQVSALNGYDHYSYWKASRAYSSSANGEEKMSESQPRPLRLEDFQHEEIVGPTVDRDMSALANEMRQALADLRDVTQKFSTFLIAVGSVHLIWGGVMFLAMETPLSHAVLTQVCMSALVFVGLAYHSRQALKPIAFFTKLEERSRLRILTLSLQATKAITSFFERGYGIGLVLSLTLTAHLLGCVKVFFF